MTRDENIHGPDDDALGDRVAHFLKGRAAEVSPADAWDDLASRVAHDARRRERLLAGMLLVALLGGPVLGFAVGRAGDGGDAVVDVRAGGDDDREGGEGEAAAASDEEPGAGQGYASMPSIGTDGFGMAEPLDLLFLRTVEGIDIRAYREEIPPLTFEGEPSDWTPPEGCYPTGSLLAEVSSELMVGENYGTLYGTEGVTASMGVVGLRESAPAWVVIAEAPGAAAVRARFADGATDEMAPVDGVAVLAHPAPLPAEIDANAWQGLYEAGATVEALDSGGAVVASTGVNEEVPFRDECEPPPPPPPSLPEPGAEQPADVEAARAAVNQAFADAFTGANDVATRLDAIERGDELAGLMEDLAGGTFAEQVTDATAEVRDVVFVSATEAAVLFDIAIENYSDFANQVGGAVLVDGRWKVSYDTVCSAVSLAMASCPA